MDANTISREVVDASVKVHKALGPGLLESVYELVLAKELRKRGLSVTCRSRSQLIMRERPLVKRSRRILSLMKLSF